jgi:hypothetical protein
MRVGGSRHCQQRQPRHLRQCEYIFMVNRLRRINSHGRLNRAQRTRVSRPGRYLNGCPSTRPWQQSWQSGLRSEGKCDACSLEHDVFLWMFCSLTGDRIDSSSRSMLFIAAHVAETKGRKGNDPPNGLRWQDHYAERNYHTFAPEYRGHGHSFGNDSTTDILDRIDHRVSRYVGMNRWVGLGVIADNIVNIGRAMEKQAAL